ncbi:hypothetical protein SLEP1_g7827 [Rubroshorea leprosula]|uniref:Exonuclease 1 n=1 Tax=Rubroshorea leprosula TaxID=152421 RepID=A0AAV5HZN5_9ROSI|nr:hypothetical protein SLEP1_g7827 [Rubroshorea leprosula]
MGIQGLLPLLKSIMVPIHIKDLQGCSVAVDTYSWLHKGALSCSRELCKGLATSRHIEYCMHRVNLLRHYGAKPVLVFDGGLLPMKIEQENKRARARKENLERAIEHESCGNSSAAYECYQKAVDISPSIAHELIQVLKQESVCYVVAPYEADAQMTFLALSKQVDAVITEDSDLIPFGCPRVIFKMDKFGQGVEFKHSTLQQNKELSFSGFTKQMLLEMCILSGCDYLQSLPGMGLKKAHALIKKFKSYDKVIKHLRYSSVSVPPLYEESFRKALLTFQHQRVYDLITEDIVHLSEITSDIAQGIAKGDLDPFTQMQFEVGTVSSQLVLDKNSHPKSFKPLGERKKLDLPVQKNLLTKYFCFASLEAKRNFKAPRVSPKHPCPAADSSPSPEEHVNMEAVSGEINNSLSSSPNSENMTKIFPNNSVENGSTFKILECSESQDNDATKSPKDTILRQYGKPTNNPFPASQNEYDCKNVPDAVVSKARTESRKVIVRSCYFQHKQVNETNLENKQKLCSEDDTIMHEHGVFDVPNVSSFKGATIKRKTSPTERFEMENIKPKNMRVDASLNNDDGYCEPNLEEKSVEMNAGGKFGSNISHLDRYSDIAQKSMENFVSVISSFRFTSPGSRASGLRPPLKDVRNTSTNRSSTSLDLSQFAYLPKNKKTTSASRRC